jgi:hypothetical protein
VRWFVDTRGSVDEPDKKNKHLFCSWTPRTTDTRCFIKLIKFRFWITTRIHSQSTTHIAPINIMKLITFVFATLWYVAHAQEEQGSSSTFLRGAGAGGGSGENNVNVEMATIVKESGVEQTTNAASYYGDEEGMNHDQRKLQTLGDWAICYSNNACRNGCCSNHYSHDGKYKCTPLNGGFNADICGNSNKLRDWAFCFASSACRNGCCSNRYSNDGRMKCTPVGGFKAGEGCIAV